MRAGTSGVASVVVRATPEAVYDTVTDVTRMGEWSPECTGGRWLGGADRAVEGARFVGTNRKGPMRWATAPRVEVADRPRTFAFVMGLPVYGDLTRWTYEIAPGANGTSEVTERFEMLRDLPTPVALFERYLMRVPDRERDLQHNLETSLQRLRRLVEHGHVQADR